MRDDRPVQEADDRAAADLSAERQEKTLEALYVAAMLGLDEPMLRHLLRECGLTWRDLEQYTPPILRLSNQPETPSTLDLNF